MLNAAAPCAVPSSHELSPPGNCKRIRNDQGGWGSLEGYIEKRSRAEFSHGICPDCYAKHVEPQLGGGA